MPRAANKSAVVALPCNDDMHEQSVTVEDKENIDGDDDFDATKGRKARQSKRAAQQPVSYSSGESAASDTDGSPKKRKRGGGAQKKTNSVPMAGGYDVKACAALEKAHPTPKALAPGPGMIHVINADTPLNLVPTEMLTPGCVYGMDLSADGQLLATVTTLGDINIWDATDFTLLKTIRDKEEANIDEFFVVRFTPDGKSIYVGGKRKSRTRWDPRDDDNMVLACHVKIFDVETGARVGQLVGHREEVLHIALVQYKGSKVAITASQDGTIIKWTLANDWRTLEQHETLHDLESSMVFHISMLPGTGNRYLVAAADSTVRVFDVELGKKVAEFADLYTSFCDSVVVVDSELAGVGAKAGEWTLLTRGVEVVNDDDGLPTRDNTCGLHVLRGPTGKSQGQWTLSEVRRYADLQFHANSYLCRIASNGRYLCAPTVTGSVFVWNVATGEKVAILNDGAQGREIRDIIFHSSRPLLFTCGDDGSVRVYQSADA